MAVMGAWHLLSRARNKETTRLLGSKQHGTDEESAESEADGWSAASGASVPGLKTAMTRRSGKQEKSLAEKL